jgi:7-cyano-7-deazaguanine reductase
VGSSGKKTGFTEKRQARAASREIRDTSDERRGYTEEHAKSGIASRLPELETWPNQYKGYEISIEIPEYTAICPKTGLPDFGTIRLRYMPDKACVELKSLKLYIHAYRNVGIFYENAVNRILQDVVAACRPVWATVTGEFTARGGLRTIIEAKHP